METRRRTDMLIQFKFGTPILAKKLRQLDQSAVADERRRRTMLVDPKAAHNPDKVFIWMSQITSQLWIVIESSHS